MVNQKKAQTMENFQRHDKDVGSSEMQIALLTHRIGELTQHLSGHKHDNSTRRGLIKLVGQRRRLLRYLRSDDTEKYYKVSAELKITAR